ncbi:MAG: hypothetical protein HPY97_03435 [Rikenellaceae bacterium]|jgi:hypothetical protein|nr:hypothetical protein [Rikenellaceae bacterium]
MRNFYLLLLSGLLLASCVKEELPQPSEGEESFTAAVTRSTGEKDPYKLSLVQEVLDAKLAQMGQPKIVLEPTHQYVCFSPADSAQVARLEALDLITSYNPVGEEGRPIPEPDEDSQGEILPLYSVVPIGFQFPEDIPYTKIYDVYIQSLGGAGSASGSEEQLSTDLFKDVLTQTLAATGHTSVATRAGESQQEWNPSARFRFHVDVGDNSDTILPLKQLNVVVVQGSNQKRYYTDADGRITVTDKFIGPVDYQVVWDSHHFVIRQGNTWTRRGSWCKGHTEPLDTVLTSQCGLDYFLAGSHRALTAYYTEPNLVPGLVREQKLLNIGIVDKETPFKWEGRYVPILTAVIGEHALTMYAKASADNYHSSKSAMQTTFHELGHASHYYKNAGSYSAMYCFGRRKDMESWANGVSYAYTRALLGEEYEWSGTTNEEYTRLIECLLLNGFTMEQIQYDFYGSDDWGHWQSRIRARSDKQISDRLVNLIFDNPNDYHFDMRDMAEVSDTRIRLYQPVRLSIKDIDKYLPATWEITEGTGATILNNNTSKFLVCFTEPGEKTLRATVELAPGIEETFDKTVTVSNTSIVSVPGTATEGYPVTVSVMDLEICPDAKVTEWSVVQGDATITPKTDRSAQYTFRQPGNMTVKLKIQFQPNGPEVEYTAPIRVQPLDVYSVFGVINAPETYAYNTTYQAKYMGTETDVEIVDVEADHRTHYPYYPFDTWSYNKSTRTLSFLIPDHPLVFDYKLIIHYKVNGVEVEEPAILIVSNFPDTPASQTTDTTIGE